MNSYIIFCANAIYENDRLVEIAENLYWIEAECSLDAFDDATTRAKSHADFNAIAFKDKRDFIGITEVLPIIDILKNGSIIGHRLYSSEDASDIQSSVMSREEFIELEARHFCDDEK